MGEEATSAFLEADANAALANAKLRAVPQHGRFHALFVEEGAVRGVEILQVDEFVADFQEAVVTRDFRIVQGNVSPLSPDDDAWLGQPEDLAAGRPGGNGKDKHTSRGQLQ